MNVNRAYSTLVLKGMDEETREITGIASTPSTDRVGDIVESKGAIFKLPIPLLYQHRHDQPIGHVTAAKVTDKGIEITAKLVKIVGETELAKRLEDAWQSIKTGLVGGLSIGFSPKEYSILDDGGLRFTSWEWNELSAVTIPANAEASITSIKSLDQEFLAASGTKQIPDSKDTPPVGVTTTKTVKLIKPQEGAKMNYSEQIKSFEETRVAKKAEMAAIMEKSAESGETLDSEQKESYDTLRVEVKEIGEHLDRLKEAQADSVEKATPVDDVTGMTKRVPIKLKHKENLEKGIGFARYAMCLASSKGDLTSASKIAETRYPHDENLNVTLKAAVAAGTTTDSTWAAPLVEYNDFAGDFVEFLRPQTILGKFGMGSVPALRNVPFNVNIKGETAGGAGYWVGEGLPAPLTESAFNSVYMGYTKVANIAVLTNELVRLSNPNAERLVRDTLASALISRLDTDFIDPAKSASANVSPASITNGVSATNASGTDADAVRADVAAAMGTFIAANHSVTTGVWIMSQTTALTLSLMRNALGQKEFPEMTMTGGSLEGLPVITSEYVPTVTAGTYLILANTSDIYVADDGGIVIDASREASLQMLDNPTNASGTGTATSMVSMFQNDSIAIKAERWINWQKRRATAVAVIDAVNYAL